MMWWHGPAVGRPRSACPRVPAKKLSCEALASASTLEVVCPGYSRIFPDIPRCSHVFLGRPWRLQEPPLTLFGQLMAS